MTVRSLDLDTLVLGHGSHDSPEEGMCVMEAVAFVAGESHSDRPACASPVIAAFLRRWNDDLDNASRQRLKPYVLRVVGSKASASVESVRAWLVTDWLVREHTPAWLDLAGLGEQATALRALPPITSAETARAGQPTIDTARTKSAAAGAAARAAAWDAARAAARAAAWDAAGAAARAAAWDAAWDAARAAARAAAWDAARAAAWDAARAAAWDAAKKKLAPTITSLQTSAFALLDRLLDVEAAVSS